MPVPTLILSREHRRVGDSTRHLERAAAAGGLVRVRPGVFAYPSEWSLATAEEQHLARMRAVAAKSRRPLVFSHASAAVALGVPAVDVDLSRPHLSQPAALDARLVAVTTHRAELDESDVVEAEGLRVTSRFRTVVDLAATGSFVTAVVAIDDAIAKGTASDDILRWVEDRRPFRGARRIEAAAAIAVGRSESALESLSLARIHELGFPAPQQQVGLGTYRGDFVWPNYGVWGEADGRLKYLTGDALLAEKRREDDIRRSYPRFVRWDWDDAWRGTPLAAKLVRAGLPRDRRIASSRPA